MGHIFRNWVLPEPDVVIQHHSPHIDRPFPWLKMTFLIDLVLYVCCCFDWIAAEKNEGKGMLDFVRFDSFHYVWPAKICIRYSKINLNITIFLARSDSSSWEERSGAQYACQHSSSNSSCIAPRHWVSALTNS